MALTPEPAWRNPTAWGPALLGAVEAALDPVVTRAINDPLPVVDADAVRHAVRGPATGATTFVLPVLTGATKRWSRRISARLPLAAKALLTAVPPLATSIAQGAQELHALASLVVNRLRAEGLPVDRRFVQRVAVNAYVWPGGGRALEQPHPPALPRLAGLWVTRPLTAERPGEWVGRAAETIERADLREHLARYDGLPPPAVGAAI